MGAGYALSQRTFVIFMPVIYMSLDNVSPPSNALQAVAQTTSEKSQQELLVLIYPAVADVQQGRRVKAAPGTLILNFFFLLQLRFQDLM